MAKRDLTQAQQAEQRIEILRVLSALRYPIDKEGLESEWNLGEDIFLEGEIEVQLAYLETQRLIETHRSMISGNRYVITETGTAEYKNA